MGLNVLALEKWIRTTLDQILYPKRPGLIEFCESDAIFPLVEPAFVLKVFKEIDPLILAKNHFRWIGWTLRLITCRIQDKNPPLLKS